jgi:hypothetical protein
LEISETDFPWVGQTVRLKHPFRGHIAEIVEDRGPLGVDGRCLYAVRPRLDTWNEDTTELPEESLEALADGAAAPAAPEGKD